MSYKLQVCASFIISAALVGCTWGGGQMVSDYQDKRDEMLTALAGISPTSTSRVRAVPDLAAGRPYKVGDVLTPSTWPDKLTTACTRNIPSEKATLIASPDIQSGRNISFSAQPPTLIQKAIAEVADFKVSFGNKKSANLSYEPVSQEGITTHHDFLNALAKDSDCLAQIGNKTSFVVTRVFNMKQQFKGSSSDEIGGSVKVFKTDSFELKYNNNGEFTVKDATAAPRALMLQEFRFNVNVDGLSDSQSVAEKRRIIQNALQNETEQPVAPVELWVSNESPSVLLLPE